MAGTFKAANNLEDFGDMDAGDSSDKENELPLPKMLPPDRYKPTDFRGTVYDPMLDIVYDYDTVQEPAGKKRKASTPLKETKQLKKIKAAPTRRPLSPVKKAQPAAKAPMTKSEPMRARKQPPAAVKKQRPAKTLAPKPSPKPEQAKKQQPSKTVALNSDAKPEPEFELEFEPESESAMNAVTPFMIAQVMGNPTAAKKAQKIIDSRRIPTEEELSAMSTQLRDEMVKQKKPKVLKRIINNTQDRCADINARTEYLKQKIGVVSIGTKQARNSEDEIAALRVEGRVLGALSYLAQHRLGEVEKPAKGKKARKTEKTDEKADEKADEQAAEDAVEDGE